MYDIWLFDEMKGKDGLVFKTFLPADDKDMRIIFADFSKTASLCIGRGNASDIQINDLTVSRTHAELIRIGDKVFIEDKVSKFGTQIAWRRGQLELSNKLMCLQVEKYLVFLQNPLYSFKFLCFNKTIDFAGVNDYESQLISQIKYEKEFVIKNLDEEAKEYVKKEWMSNSSVSIIRNEVNDYILTALKGKQASERSLEAI